MKGGGRPKNAAAQPASGWLLEEPEAGQPVPGWLLEEPEAGQPASGWLPEEPFPSNLAPPKPKKTQKPNKYQFSLVNYNT